MKMSVAKALKEIKVTDDKINRAREDGVYIGISQAGKDVSRVYKTEQDMIKGIQSSFDKMDDLRKYRARLKAAVVLSNATTKVNLPLIGEVTVAEAIEYKSVVTERKTFLNKISKYYNQVSMQAQQVEQQNQQVIDQRINALFSGDQKPDETLVKTIKDQVEQERGIKIIDPKDLKEFYTKELDEIIEFEGNVDDILNTSNVMTTIEV